MKAWFVHNIFGRTYKVNTTKYIKMVSITSIETKLVQKKAQYNCTDSGWDLESELDLSPLILVKNESLGLLSLVTDIWSKNKITIALWQEHPFQQIWWKGNCKSASREQMDTCTTVQHDSPEEWIEMLKSWHQFLQPLPGCSSRYPAYKLYSKWIRLTAGFVVERPKKVQSVLWYSRLQCAPWQILATGYSVWVQAVIGGSFQKFWDCIDWSWRFQVWI